MSFWIKLGKEIGAKYILRSKTTESQMQMLLLVSIMSVFNYIYMALENFIEMRDLVADPHFLFKRKVQHLLGNEYPGRFLTRYEMVSFSRIPYKECVRLGEIGDKLTEELIKDTNEDVSILPQLDKQIAVVEQKVKNSKALMDKYFPQ